MDWAEIYLRGHDQPVRALRPHKVSERADNRVRRSAVICSPPISLLAFEIMGQFKAINRQPGQKG